MIEHRDAIFFSFLAPVNVYMGHKWLCNNHPHIHVVCMTQHISETLLLYVFFLPNKACASFKRYF